MDPSNESTRKILEKQLQLLSEYSMNLQWDVDDICKLTAQMVSLAQTLDTELRSQSFYAASTNHPYVVQLPVADLVDLYVAREEAYYQSGPSRETGIEKLADDVCRGIAEKTSGIWSAQTSNAP